MDAKNWYSLVAWLMTQDATGVLAEEHLKALSISGDSRLRALGLSGLATIAYERGPKYAKQALWYIDEAMTTLSDLRDRTHACALLSLAHAICWDATFVNDVMEYHRLQSELGLNPLECPDLVREEPVVSPWIGRLFIACGQYYYLTLDYGAAAHAFQLAAVWHAANTGPYDVPDQHCQLALVHLMQGQLYLEYGNEEKASTYLDLAKVYMPESSWRSHALLYLAGKLALRQGKVVVALDCADQLEQAGGNYAPKGTLLRAEVAEIQESPIEYIEIIAAWRKAVEVGDTATVFGLSRYL